MATITLAISSSLASDLEKLDIGATAGTPGSFEILKNKTVTEHDLAAEGGTVDEAKQLAVIHTDASNIAEFSKKFLDKFNAADLKPKINSAFPYNNDLALAVQVLTDADHDPDAGTELSFTIQGTTNVFPQKLRDILEKDAYKDILRLTFPYDKNKNIGLVKVTVPKIPEDAEKIGKLEDFTGDLWRLSGVDNTEELRIWLAEHYGPDFVTLVDLTFDWTNKLETYRNSQELARWNSKPLQFPNEDLEGYSSYDPITVMNVTGTDVEFPFHATFTRSRFADQKSLPAEWVKDALGFYQQNQVGGFAEKNIAALREQKLSSGLLNVPDFLTEVDQLNAEQWAWLTDALDGDYEHPAWMYDVLKKHFEQLVITDVVTSREDEDYPLRIIEDPLTGITRVYEIDQSSETDGYLNEGTVAVFVEEEGSPSPNQTVDFENFKNNEILQILTKAREIRSALGS